MVIRVQTIGGNQWSSEGYRGQAIGGNQMPSEVIRDHTEGVDVGTAYSRRIENALIGSVYKKMITLA